MSPLQPLRLESHALALWLPKHYWFGNRRQRSGTQILDMLGACTSHNTTEILCSVLGNILKGTALNLLFCPHEYEFLFRLCSIMNAVIST